MREKFSFKAVRKSFFYCPRERDLNPVRGTCHTVWIHRPTVLAIHALMYVHVLRSQTVGFVQLNGIHLLHRRYYIIVFYFKFCKSLCRENVPDINEPQLFRNHES